MCFCSVCRERVRTAKRALIASRRRLINGKQLRQKMSSRPTITWGWLTQDCHSTFNIPDHTYNTSTAPELTARIYKLNFYQIGENRRHIVLHWIMLLNIYGNHHIVHLCGNVLTFLLLLPNKILKNNEDLYFLPKLFNYSCDNHKHKFLSNRPSNCKIREHYQERSMTWRRFFINRA